MIRGITTIPTIIITIRAMINSIYLPTPKKAFILGSAWQGYIPKLQKAKKTVKNGTFPEHTYKEAIVIIISYRKLSIYCLSVSLK